MKRLVASLLAEGVSVDQFTKRMTLFNELDHIFAPAVPAMLSRLNVVLIYELGASPAFEERVIITEPNGVHIADSQTKIREEEADCTRRSLHTFWQVRLNEHGVYRVSVAHRIGDDGAWEEVGSRALTVFRASHPLLPSISTP